MQLVHNIYIYMFCLQYIRCNLNIVQEALLYLALLSVTFLKRAIKIFSLAPKLSNTVVLCIMTCHCLEHTGIVLLSCDNYMYTTLSILSLSDSSTWHS